MNSLSLGLDGLYSYPELDANPTARADVRVLIDSADSMQRILNETLDMERMAAGSYSLELGTVSSMTQGRHSHAS